MLCVGLIYCPLITSSVIWITTQCGLARKVGSRFLHSLTSLYVNLASVTPPQELYRILAWTLQQAVSMFNFVLIFDVQNMPTQISPQNLWVTGGRSALSISNNCSRYSLSQATLSGADMLSPGKNIAHHSLISLNWHKNPVICNPNHYATNFHIWTPCAQTLQVPLVPSNLKIPMMLWTIMACVWSSSHVLFFPLQVSILSPTSVSWMCSRYLWS